MRRRTLAAVAVAFVLVLAGCSGTGPTDGTTTSPSHTTAEPPAGSLGYDVTVFDSGWTGQPILEGGLAYPDDFDANASHYATLLTDASDTERFNRSQLPDDIERFVDETDFETASLVVVQAYPKSSVPDYRVESVTRDGGRLDVRLNDSSEMGTDDITLETVLIRVDHDGTPPSEARIETQTGLAFDTDDGHVTTGHSPPADAAPIVDLPLWSTNLSDNVDDPRDLSVTNRGEQRLRYNVTVVGTFTPDCRYDEPACGKPDYRSAVFQRRATLGPGDTDTFANIVARHGTYDVIVTARPPGSNGDSTRETGIWRVFFDGGDALVRIGDGSVSIA